jgi:TolA-binding protein
VLAVVAFAMLAAMASSCAYYNTFYLARRYYFKATNGAPYEVDRFGSSQAPNYAKTIDYCKKLIAQYPKSKWVDDAFLLWARALIGQDDPLQTINMLQDFITRFPKTDQRAEATFFLGLAYRNARRFTQAVDAFDNFIRESPRHMLVPYAQLERARALVALGRYSEASAAASVILERYPKSELVDKARLQRAEARFKDGDFAGSRTDYAAIEANATSDADRFQYLMREADCLESAREYDAELALLRGELSHTPPPVTSNQPSSTPSGDAAQLPPGATQLPGRSQGVSGSTSFSASEKYGRLTMRVGTALLLAGHMPEALEQFSFVLKDYPKTVLGAEAQYRVGYAYETVADDFDRAVQEYAKVKEQFGLTQYTQQAQQRSDDLGRITQYRKGAGADSLEKKAEAGFLTAERYLFEQKRYDRALTEYANVATTYPGTAVAARALNAQAWVLSRKLDRKPAADSLFWKVVREYPATEAQVAARDYLEADGQEVPDSLIVLPAPPAPTAADSARALTPIPPTTPALGSGLRPGAEADSLHGPPGRGLDPRFGAFPGMARDSLGMPILPHAPAPGDSLARPRGLFAPPPPSAPPAATPPGTTTPAPQDTTHTSPQGTTPSAPRDTTHATPPGTTTPAPRDTTHTSPPGTTTPASRDTTHASPPGTTGHGGSH